MNKMHQIRNIFDSTR